MWTNRNYDELQTLEEYIASHSGSIFPNSTFDEATKTNIIDWFRFRKVCDNDKFGVFFKRKCLILSKQYNAYLRVENTEYDPLIISYFEAQNKDKMETTGSTKATDSRTTTGTDGSTTQTNGTTSGTNRITESGKTNETGENVTDGETTGSITRNTNTSNEQTDTLTHNTTVTNQTTENNKSLHGETPASNIGQTGMPENLNWQYLSSQDESKNTTNGTSATTGTETTATEGSTTGRENVTESGTNDTTITNTLERTDTKTTEGTESGTTSNTTTVSGTNKNESTGENTVENTGATESNRAARSKTSGNAAELLDKARAYILNTNAFAWLIRELEPCFMMVFEEE